MGSFHLIAAASIFITITLLSSESEARPETNFASSSITSDGNGSRGSHFVGSIPDSSSDYTPKGRIGGGGAGAATFTSGNGRGGGGGATILSTGSNNGETVRILTQSGPSGTRHTVIGPSNNGVFSRMGPQGSSGSSTVIGTSSGGGGGGSAGIFSRNGGSQDYYPYSGQYYNSGFPAQAVAVAGPGGAGSFAGAGAGSFAGAGGFGTGAYAGSNGYPYHQQDYDY